MSYGHVNVVGGTPKIVNISMVIDGIIDFFDLDILLVHYGWRRVVTCTGTWYVLVVHYGWRTDVASSRSCMLWPNQSARPIYIPDMHSFIQSRAMIGCCIVQSGEFKVSLTTQKAIFVIIIAWSTHNSNRLHSVNTLAAD